MLDIVPSKTCNSLYSLPYHFMLVAVTDHIAAASRLFRLIECLIRFLQQQVKRAMPDFPLGNACTDRQDSEAFILFERLKEIINKILHTPRDILAYHTIREYDEKFIAADTNIQRIGEMFFD